MKKHLTISNIIYLVLLLVILVQMYMLIFRKPDVVVQPFDDTELREEIAEKDSLANYWQAVASSWQAEAEKYEAKSDSLEQTKVVIKHHYHEIYKAIPDGTSVQLDSIIRANWK